jgi:hypothetical protein
MSHERDPIWDALKSHSKEKFDSDRAGFMAQAIAEDDGNWTKHTAYHWSRFAGGQRVDYWPSRKKFLIANKVMRGDVMAHVRKLEQKR